jgi:peptide/nickel transport system substrate-binding protein
MISAAGPWGTGPYKLVKGFSLPDKRSGEVVLEANAQYWDRSRFPRVRRIVFDNTTSQAKALELVMRGDRRVDMVTGLSPLDTLKVAQSAHAKVVKNRNFHGTVFGHLNMRKADSPWRDVRVRQAANLAINRADLIQYGANGNGQIVPALVPANDLGYPDGLAPYPFEPERARALLREAGYSEGLSIGLIAPESLRVQATVVSRMLEQAGFKVEQEVLDPTGYNRRVNLPTLDRPAEQQTWDIALAQEVSWAGFPPFDVYWDIVVGGTIDWVEESPELRRLLNRTLEAVDAREQGKMIAQMERIASEQAYLLFLYQPIDLVAVKKHVTHVTYPVYLILAEAAVAGRPR